MSPSQGEGCRFKSGPPLTCGPYHHAGVAQSVEQCFRKAEVAGSIPAFGSYNVYSVAGLASGVARLRLTLLIWYNMPMSKSLGSHRQSHYQKKMFFIFGGLGLFVIFMAVFGLNFLINIGVWFNGLVSNEPEEVQARDEFFGTLFVNNPPAATNSASLIISGNTTEFDTVTFIINDEEVKEAQVLNADSFTEKIGALKPGSNTVQVIATATKQKQTKESDVFTIKYINTKPKIEISEPANGAEITKDEIVIKGSTDKNNSVEIDGAPVVVSATGTFEEEVRLKDGENLIEILAIDEAGNEEKIELKIIYKKE